MPRGGLPRAAGVDRFLRGRSGAQIRHGAMPPDQARVLGAADMTRFVSYLRVSTQRQGAAGLGLEAQREAVARHVARHGGAVLAEFVEVEGGRRSDRPELAAALAAC